MEEINYSINKISTLNEKCNKIDCDDSCNEMSLNTAYYTIRIDVKRFSRDIDSKF